MTEDHCLKNVKHFIETSNSFARQPRLALVRIGIRPLKTEWSACNLFPPPCSHKLQILYAERPGQAGGVGG